MKAQPKQEALFSLAMGHIDNALSSIEEFNKIAKTLEAMGYGISGGGPRGNETGMPYAEVVAPTVCGYRNVSDSSFMDEIFFAGVHKPKAKTRRRR